MPITGALGGKDPSLLLLRVSCTSPQNGCCGALESAAGELAESKADRRFAALSGAGMALYGATGNPPQCVVQAGEWPAPDGGGDATADRPGGFGQIEEGAGAALAGARVRRTTEQIIHSDSIPLWRW